MGDCARKTRAYPRQIGTRRKEQGTGSREQGAAPVRLRVVISSEEPERRRVEKSPESESAVTTLECFSRDPGEFFDSASDLAQNDNTRRLCGAAVPAAILALINPAFAGQRPALQRRSGWVGGTVHKAQPQAVTVTCSGSERLGDPIPHTPHLIPGAFQSFCRACLLALVGNL